MKVITTNHSYGVTRKIFSNGSNYFLRVNYYSSNNGSAFARNYSATPVSVEIVKETFVGECLPPETKTFLREEVTSVTSAKDANYYSRKYIRDNKLVAKFK